MSQDHRLQQQRFELKYLVRPERLQPVRDFVGSYLELDDFSAGKPDNAYDIHSLYLDSPGLHTHNATINGEKNRFKLRLRYYDSEPDSPVFCEVKRRVDDCILKSRCPVRRDAVPLVLSGITPDDSQLLGREERHRQALHRFMELMLRINAAPRLRNHYHREAWVSPHDNTVRVTLDRDIFIEPCFHDDLSATLRHPKHIYSEFIVLELKFTGRFPMWFNSMITHFNLVRSAAMKYCGGVASLGETIFQRPGLTREALELLTLNQ
jgi:hypothetical protein